MGSIDAASETERLEGVAADSWYAKGANGSSVRYAGRVLARFFAGNSCLELGPAEGVMTEQLADHFSDLTLVDGSDQFCADLRIRFPSARVVRSLFEEYHPDRCFDTVVISHVLEHVSDPRGLLSAARNWVSPEGRLLAVVPNSRSLHRQAAVIMGLLSHEGALNDTDRHHGHRRVYDPESFRADVRESGFAIEMFGGYWIKPLSNAQLEDWSSGMLDAFMVLGERYPDIAAEIYVVARPA